MDINFTNIQVSRQFSIGQDKKCECYCEGCKPRTTEQLARARGTIEPLGQGFASVLRVTADANDVHV